MLRTALIALAALVVIGAAPAQAKPPYWVVRDADSEILMFGSVHVLPPGLDWRPAELDAALARADDLWFELPMDPQSEMKVAMLAAQRGTLPADKSLSGLLSAEGAQRLAKALDGTSVSPAVIDRLEPWFAEVLLAAAQFQKAGADISSGVEKTLSASAPAAARRQAFETPEEQIAIFDAAPMDEQVASLERSLIELETDPDSFQALVADWISGDIGALNEDVLGPMRKASPGLYQRLVTDRNTRWIATLRTRMAGQGRTVVVVGVGHLVGDDGLPARLRALGYSVEGP